MRMSENLENTTREIFQEIVTEGKYYSKKITPDNIEEIILYYDFDEIGEKNCVAVANYAENEFRIDRELLENHKH